MSYPLPLTRTEAYLAYKAGVIQQSELKPSLAVPRIGIDAWLAYWTGLKNDYPKNPDGTPKMLQEEEKYIAYLCGVTDTYPENCYRRVGAYLRYIISARWGRPDHPLNREELYLSLIKTQVVPSGDPSSDIVIDGTTKAPFQDVKMYGDTFQQSYTGKNLFNIEAIPYVAKRAYGPGGAVLDWTDYAGTNEYQPVEPNTEYTLWNNKIGNTTYLCEYDENKNFIQRLVAIKTFTTTATTKYLRWSLNVGTGEIPPTRTQLELGSTVTAYEPYVGGQPSPNPDYPQPIQTVTGIQTVEVRGKNLWGGFASDFSKTSQGVSYTNKADGVIFANGTASGNSLSFISTEAISSGRIITLQAGDYVISGGTSTVALQVVSPSGEEIAETASDGVKAFTLSEATKIFVRARMARNTVADNVTIYPQLEKGSTATDYIPYSKQTYTIDLGTIELCKIGDYQDYIYKDGENWKVHKWIGKYTYDGTESNWAYSTNVGVGADVNGVFYRAKPTGADGTNYPNPSVSISDHFISGVRTPTKSGTFIIGSNITFASPSTAIDNVTEWTQWLASNNTTVYYKYIDGSVTDTVITDTNLIAQLDSLVNGGAENGTTYIKVSATDPNLPGLLYVEAPKYE